MFKLVFKRIIPVILSVCLVIGVTYKFTTRTYAEVTQDDIDAIKERQSELEKLDSELDAEIETARADISKQKDLCVALEKKIDNQQSEIDSVLQAIDVLNNEISQKEAAIADVQNEIDSDTERLRQRIKSLYLAGDTTTLEIILGAKDFDDLLDKSYVIKQMGEADAKIVDGLNSNMESIREEKEIIESDKDELLTQKAKLETKMAELNELQSEYNTVLSGLEDYKSELEAQKSANASEKKSLVNELNEAEAELAAQYAAQQNSDNGSNYTSYIDSYAYVSSGSGYCWPAPQCSIITAYWGDDRGHKGIDLACAGSAYGLPIVAAQSGTVTIANGSDSWGQGWGYYIKIDHGNGYSTLYAHCSQVVVSPGQSVERGELIGYIGNTGNSYGAHLHFECWYGDIRYDPLTELA
ncbi:MAG: peptidoglycan DD-metalloendopeptidase family protein [Clostridiales bacterium]|nr:peptidoglycan DD-metalloendopeptidase family protein [Clostridiales bacterium]